MKVIIMFFIVLLQPYIIMAANKTEEQKSSACTSSTRILKSGSTPLQLLQQSLPKQKLTRIFPVPGFRNWQVISSEAMNQIQRSQ